MSGKPVPHSLFNPKSVDFEETPEESYEFSDPGQDLQRVNIKSLELPQNTRASRFNKFNGTKKSLTLSLAQFKKGNNFFRNEEYLEALKCYTRSAADAGDDKNRLAIAYEKRALCFMRIDYFNCAVQDFDRALQLMEENHPARKAILRKKEAAQKVALPYDFRYHEYTPFYGKKSQHPQIQSAKKYLEIIYEVDEHKATGIQTKTFIAPGEVVSVERPYACVLANEGKSNNEYNCHHCFELCLNMIPCPSCPDALYCSEDCLEEAFEDYHQFECIIYYKLTGRIPVKHSLALRTALIGEYEYGENLDEKMSSSQYTEGYRSDRLKEIMDMEGSSQADKLKWEDYEAAAYAHKILKEYTTFFRNEQHENQFKKIYMHLIRIHRSKSLEIFETLGVINGNVTLGTLGYGFYPFNSLFGHSCVPNLMRVFYGNVAVLVAIKNIKPGDMCTVAYGGAYFTEADLHARKTWLKFVYDISCNCIACQNDWPTMEKFRTEVGENYRNFDVSYQKLLEMVENRPDAKTARKVMKSKYEDFQPITCEMRLIAGRQGSFWAKRSMYTEFEINRMDVESHERGIS